MARDLKLQVLLSAVDKITAPLRRIAQGSGAVAQALKASREQLKQLNAQQRDVSSFRTLKSASQETATALAASQARVRELAQAVAAAEAPSRKLSAEFKRAQREAQALKQKHGEQQRELQGLRGRLGEAGISTRNLGNHERELRQRIADTNRAINQHTERLRRATEQQQRLAKAQEAYNRAQNIAGKLAVGGAAGLATGYALSRPLSAVVGAYAPAEDAATQLRASMMGADGSVAEDFAKISTLATQLGDRLPGTTAQFQEMMTMLRRQGLSAQSILGGTGEAAAYLAVQLKMGSSDAAEFAAKMQDATRTTEGDMMGLMDTIQRTFYLGVDPTNMLYGFSKLSPALGILRKSGLEATNTLAPLLVMMDQVGMSGEPAGNALRKVFQAGLDLDKVSKANKEIKKLGINLDFTDGKGEFGGLDKLFAQLDKLKKLDSVKRISVLSTIFGDDSETLQVVQTMIDKGIAGYQEVAGKMQAQANLRKRVDEQLQTLTNVMDAASGSWTNALAEFGAAVAPELKELIKSLGSLASGIGAWARANPELAAGLVKVTAVIAALAIGGGTLALILAGLVGPLAMAKLGMATFGITTSAALGPVLLIIGVVAALAAGAYLVWQNWGALGPMFAALWEGIKSQLGSLMTWFSGLPERFKQFGADILQGLANGITGAFGSVKEAITGAGGAAIDWFKEKLGIHSPSRVFSQLGEYTMQGLEQGIGAAMSGPLEAIQEVSKSLAGEAAKAMELTPPTDAVESPTQNVLLNIENMQVSLIGISRLFAQFGTAIRAVGSALMMLAASPVALVIAGIAAAIGGAAYLIWNNWGTLGPKFAALWEGIKVQFGSLMTWFAGLPERFRQFGADILQGLANGITGALGSVKEAITGAGGAAIGWFKEKLGIHSPSRVFAQLGGYTMQGLEQGLVAGQGGPLGAIAGLGKQLAQAGALAVGVGGAGSALAIDNRPPLAASASAPIIVQGDTITIQVSAAGGQANDLAQQINRILDERERAKAARVRSRLHDQE
ncbi:phage tail tape measure protein [Azotobacter beijerinckii]|uniref:Phage tail tape measure protein, TP901 family, core region n=1 Tax=Azotobacter beijerinckii TaxID=170623 RepID=A0A1I0ZXZ9_9GAMM|nr:phage tail tape measure protein [Azotobacter beijerinckii]SFB30417.1 phage tail tape measure protein, TP901 family, core region [Azotobacter beijerinckii]